MSIYYYRAKNIAGEIKEGKRNTSNKSALARALKTEGLVLISAKKEKTKIVIRLPSFLARVGLIEKMFFAKHLSIMLAAGVNLPKALEILRKLSRSTHFQRIINKIKNDVQRGISLSETFSKFPKVFDELFVNMVKIGEEAGNLEEVLDLLSKQMKRQHEVTQRVKGAMMYPAVIVIAMAGIGIGMMLFVVPKLLSIFEELEVELPWTTKMVLATTKLLQKQGLIILIGIILLGIFLRLITKKSKTGKRILHYLFLNIPVLGKILKKLYMARFARTFSSLVKGGVVITKALQVSSHTLGNIFYQESLEAVVQDIKKGITLNESLARFSKLYSPMVIQMINIGEETGTLSDVLERLADFYEEEVTDVTKNLASIIEPILMIVIGAVVGFFAVSMITPLYSMMGQI